MKKTFFVLLTAMVLVSGCKEKSSEQEQSIQATEPSVTTVTIGETETVTTVITTTEREDELPILFNPVTESVADVTTIATTMQGTESIVVTTTPKETSTMTFTTITTKTTKSGIIELPFVPIG